MLISFAADAFRGHGFSLLVTTKTYTPAVTRRKDTGFGQYPAVPSARAIPAEVVDSTPINRKCFSSKYLSKKVVGYFWRLLRKKRNEQDPAGRAEDACVSSAEAKEIADHIFYIVQKMNPQIFILLY